MVDDPLNPPEDEDDIAAKKAYQKVKTKNNAKEAKKKRAKSNTPKFLSACTLLSTHDDWVDLLRYDKFALAVMLTRPIPGSEDPPFTTYPRPYDDMDLLRAMLWMHKDGLDIGKESLHDAIMLTASLSSYHPLQDFLNGLKWDGQRRNETLFIRHFGAQDTGFNRAISQKFLIGAVARAMVPGCFVKNVLTLESPQDFGKSSALASLAMRREWFLDHIPDLSGHKDTPMQTHGKWIVEFAEFDAIRKTEISKVKAFLSTRVDTYRAPYGKVATDHPRQWVGAATINPGSQGYLIDTENVRFWPMACAVGWRPNQKVNLEILETLREQTWAEAVQDYREGVRWWLDTEELQIQQHEVASERVQIDSREQQVRKFLGPIVKWTTLTNVMESCGISTENQDRTKQTTFGFLMSQIGWKRYRWSNGPNGSGYYYFPPTCGIEREYAGKMNDEIRAARSATKFGPGDDPIRNPELPGDPI